MTEATLPSCNCPVLTTRMEGRQRLRLRYLDPPRDVEVQLCLPTCGYVLPVYVCVYLSFTSHSFNLSRSSFFTVRNTPQTRKVQKGSFQRHGVKGDFQQSPFIPCRLKVAFIDFWYLRCFLSFFPLLSLFLSLFSFLYVLCTCVFTCLTLPIPSLYLALPSFTVHTANTKSPERQCAPPLFLSLSHSFPLYFLFCTCFALPFFFARVMFLCVYLRHFRNR